MTKTSIPAPDGEAWRSRFHSDGSVSTNSVANHGRPFVAVRPLTDDEAEPQEDGKPALWRIEFTDERGGTFDAWNDEILCGWKVEPAYRPEDYPAHDIPQS